MFANPLHAQWPAGASPFVPADHWSYAVLRRLDAAGLLPAGADVARRSIPQEEIATLLAFAAHDDSTSVAHHYLQKFREEFPARSNGSVQFSAMASGLYRREHNQQLAGIGYDTVWVPGEQLEDVSEPTGGVRATLLTRRVAASAGSEGGALQDLQLVAASSRIGVWGGRKDAGYTTGQSGSIVLAHGRLDGGGVFLARPMVLPVLGPVRLQMQVTRVENVLLRDSGQHTVRPYLLSSRVSFELFNRFRVGWNRGMMFGGAGNYPVTFTRLLNNLVGRTNAGHESAFANQVTSMDGRLRVSSGMLPSMLYLEWGTEDLSGAWWHMPGLIAGIQLGPTLRRDIALGIERTSFARNDASNSDWYQNPWFRGGWTDNGALLGHPLGGHGTEWRVYATGGAPQQGASGQLAVYHRWRGDQNLYAPQRQGSSVGGAIGADVRLNASMRGLLQAEAEHGTDAQTWTSYTLRIGVRYRLY